MPSKSKLVVMKKASEDEFEQLLRRIAEKQKPKRPGLIKKTSAA
ncbi:MAG TPA: hypothetical protein VEJ67_13150 [Candidatus Cybelea sp.]|nr:hypothetical protein [Candidatus Cybelea sp.]